MERTNEDGKVNFFNEHHHMTNIFITSVDVNLFKIYLMFTLHMHMYEKKFILFAYTLNINSIRKINS